MIKTVKINSTWKDGMRVDAQAGDHAVIIDQPAQMGGQDAGPNPMEVFLFSLGSCLATVAAIVARQEGIDLKDFVVEIDGDYDTDFLMGKTTQGRAGFSEIREKVFIDADLSDEEQEAFFKKVYSRCPVTDNIRSQTKISYTVN